VNTKWLGFVACLAVACGAKAPATTGGFQLEPGAADCAQGYVLADSDYTSTNISALSPTGAVLSASLISSGAAPPGLTTALSGDVVFPSNAPSSHEVVLIDRYPNSVLTWVEPSTGSVRRQLSVATGFAANPHDYLELSPSKAYVSRFESNSKPGAQDFDAGGDLLIIDPGAGTVTGRIDLAQPDDGDFLPRADRVWRVGNEVWVLLQRFDADFKTAGDARLVGVDPDTDSVSWTLDVPGVAGCGGVALSPSGKALALACSGVTTDLDSANDAAPTQRSDLVLLDVTAHPPAVTRRFQAAAQLGAPLGSSVSFATETRLVAVALGDLTVKRNDLAFTLDTAVGMVEPLLDAGAAFALGDVRCAPGCTELCFLTDAQANELHVWKVNGAVLSEQPAIPGDTTIGLPPRAIGAL